MSDTRRDSASNSPILVAPAMGGAAIGFWVLAAGSSATDSYALGRDAPPTPARCCSICKGEDHGAETYQLYQDAQATAPAACGGFELKFIDQADMGWVCLFGATSDSEPTPPGSEPSEWYVPP